MTNQDLNNFAKDTDKLLGLGSVEKTNLIPNVYFSFTMNTEANAIRVEKLWNKAFTKLKVVRFGNEVTAG